MNVADMIGWVGNIGFCSGAYLVAREKKTAFFGFAWGNASYIIQGLLLGVPSLVLISFYLLSMNIYGYINWTKNERKQSNIIRTNTNLRKG